MNAKKKIIFKNQNYIFLYLYELKIECHFLKYSTIIFAK
jgi:hypothetical protein